MEANNLISINNVLEQKVYDSQDYRLGRVKDVLFDPQDNQVCYAILSLKQEVKTEGGKKYTAVPFRLLNVNPNTHHVVLNMDRSILEKAPTFGKKDWAEGGFESSSAHRYFGQDHSGEHDREVANPENNQRTKLHNAFEGSEQISYGSPDAPGENSAAGEELDYGKVKGRSASEH